MKRTATLFASLLLGVTLVQAQYQVLLPDASSLVRVGMNPHPVEEGDTTLAYTLMSAIDHADRDSLVYVQNAYQHKAVADKMKEKTWGALSYILNRMVMEGDKTDTSSLPHDLLSDDLYRYFTENQCERLKDYLVLKYELNGYRPRSVKEFINQRTFYDDMLMFNDPTRESWDKTTEIMASMPIKEGDTVLDMGCGFGYNSLRLLGLVGSTGKVYATDTEEPYVKYVANVMARGGYTNLQALHTESNSLGVDDQVDCILMSSLYHIIYTWSREDERKALLTSIKEHLKPDGHIVIVDNINLHGSELNNCHVSPELVEAQLGYWGFERESLKLLSDQRYMLVLKRNDSYVPHRVIGPVEKGQKVLDIKGQKSIVHIGSLDSYDITDRGIDAAQYVYDFMGGGDRSYAEIAIHKYDELIPEENFGGEYSALQWLCEARLASDAEREKMLADPLTRSFYHYLTDDSCRVLRYYLLHKYKLGDETIRMQSDSLLEKTGEVGRTHRSYLEDYILALNPKRPSWERTPLILENAGIRPGDVVADIGCGSGFFSHRFSRLVGEQGKVYAVEIKDEHLERLRAFVGENDIRNINILKGEEDRIELPEPVDKMFLCSLYHVMYGVIADSDRDAYLKSLIKYLNPGGELIIVDNGPVDDETLPYHSPYITPELISYQLSFYGFEQTDFIQIIPQRYMLKFKLK